jgi:DNA-binding transcriptional LysR family regulator
MSGTTSLDDLAVFVRVAELGSFVAASRILSMPRSTVSRRIATLEESLGCRLLERTTRHVRLTEEGRRLRDGASPQLRDLARLLEEVVSGEDLPAGRVRAAVPVGLGRGFGVSFLRKLHEELPHIQGEIIATDRRIDLVRDDVDIALVEGPVPDTESIARRVLTTDALCVASPAYLEKHGTPAAPRHLSEHSTLHRVLDDSREARWPLSDGGWLPVRPLIATTDVDMLYRAAVEGLGIAFLSRAVVYEALAKGELTHVLPEITEKRSYHLLYQERNPPRRVRAVMDFALEFVVGLYASI